MRTRALALGATLLLLAACSGSDAGERRPSAACADLSTGGSSFTVRLRGDAFVPSCFTASASQELELTNEDAVRHSFTVEGTPIDVDVDGGDTLDLAAPGGAVQPGTYQLICKYHLPGMTGEITIVA